MDITPSEQSYFEWLPIATPRTEPELNETEMTTFLQQQQPDKNKLWTPDGSFAFELYTVMCHMEEDQAPREDR